MPRIRYTSEIKIKETENGFFIASLIINGVVNHSTYPQRSKQNAILLINRQIERFNNVNETRLTLYGQKQRKPRNGGDMVRKASVARMKKTWVRSLELFKDYIKRDQACQKMNSKYISPVRTYIDTLTSAYIQNKVQFIADYLRRLKIWCGKVVEL